MTRSSSNANKIDKEVFMSYVNVPEKTYDATDFDKPGNSANNYYSRVFDRLEGTGNCFSWNWSAALVTGLWLAYRRMYFYAILYFVFSAAFTNLVKIIIPNPAILSTFLTLLLTTLLFGCFGNALYFRWAEKRMKRGIKPLEKNTDSWTVWFLIILGFLAIVIGKINTILVPLFDVSLSDLFYATANLFGYAYLAWRAYVNRK